MIATIAWLLFLSSTILSHAAMLHHQRVMQKKPWERFRGVQARRSILRQMNSKENSTVEAPATIGGTTTWGSIATESGSFHPDQTAEVEFRSRRLLVIGVAAVVTRWLGKILVVLNTIWIILTSIMEYIGAYDNCLCKASTPLSGAARWLVLFKGPKDLSQAATLPWGTGVTVSIFVCSAALCLFALAK